MWRARAAGSIARGGGGVNDGIAALARRGGAAITTPAGGIPKLRVGHNYPAAML